MADLSETLILIKPDAFERGLSGEILARFERKGLRITRLKLLQADEGIANAHYAEHAEKPFFGELVSFITGGPLVAAVLRGTRGGHSGAPADRVDQSGRGRHGLDRGDYGLEVTFNLVHGSDSDESAEREIGIWFRRLDRPLVLASASPRRREMLELLEIEFEVLPMGVQEVSEGEPREVVLENARRKAWAGWEASGAGATVLGVDTDVALDGRTLGKPADVGEARLRLEALSGRTHEVLSGVVVVEPVAGEHEPRERSAVALSEVTFRQLTEDALARVSRIGRMARPCRRVCDPGTRVDADRPGRGRLLQRRRAAGSDLGRAAARSFPQRLKNPIRAVAAAARTRYRCT